MSKCWHLILPASEGVIGMAGMLRVPRSRGALSGVLLVLLGIWGGLVPLIGPYVNYAYTPDHAWTLTTGRLWLEILPAAGTLVGGIVVLVSRLRPIALLGVSLAAASGAWFAFGSVLAPLWTTTLPAQGTPVGGQVARAMEQIGFFTGLGAVIVCVASVALGRLSVVSVRDMRAAERASAIAKTPDPGRTGAEPESEVPSRAPARGLTALRRVAGKSAAGSNSPEDDAGAEVPDSKEPAGSATSRP